MVDIEVAVVGVEVEGLWLRQMCAASSDGCSARSLHELQMQVEKSLVADWESSVRGSWHLLCPVRPPTFRKQENCVLNSVIEIHRRQA